MSVAFTKEGDTENAASIDLPDRPISTHANLVTPHGLHLLEIAVAQARSAFATHQSDETREGDRRALARAARDLRYYAARRASAQVMPPVIATEIVRFGACATLERADGRQQTYRIVGEDEAEPKNGTISYVSPWAGAILGKSVGDIVVIAGSAAEIVAIEL